MNELPKRFADLAKGYYDFGSSLFKFGPVGSWLQRRLGKPPAKAGIEIFVALSLSVYYFFLIAPSAAAPRPNDGNETNAYLFRYLSHHPYVPRNELQNTFTAWGGRLAGPIASGWVYDHAIPIFNKFSGSGNSGYFVINGYQFYFGYVAFGFYHSLWLFLLFLILVLYREDALLIILGVFCGLMYNFIAPAGQWFYPWDMPAMFFFTWACLLYDRGRIFPLMVVACLGSLFKETVICCALLILFSDLWSMKRRVVAFTVTILICILARKLLMMLYGVHAMAFAFNCATNPQELFTRPWATVTQNLIYLASFHLNSALFINAGVLFLILFIPWRSGRDVSFKVLVLAFLLGQVVLAGDTVFREFREWYELLPLGWMIISEYLSSRFSIAERSRSEAQSYGAVEQAKPVMVGSYWLSMSALAMVAFGVFVVGSLTASNINAYATGAVAMDITEQTGSVVPGDQASQDPRELKMAGYINNLAWALATSPNDKDRSGTLAVALAKLACEKTDYRIVVPIGTLAAAYAEAGQFPDAIATAQKACALASAQGDTNLLKSDEELLNAFQKHQPYRQTVEMLKR